SIRHSGAMWLAMASSPAGWCGRERYTAGRLRPRRNLVFDLDQECRSPRNQVFPCLFILLIWIKAAQPEGADTVPYTSLPENCNDQNDIDCDRGRRRPHGVRTARPGPGT